MGAQAQTTSVIYGKTIDSVNNSLISLTTVTNLSKGKSVTSSYSGRFIIPAETGNLLVTSHSGYNFDTVRVTPEMINDTITIRMNALKSDLMNATVVAKNRYNAYQLDSLARRQDHAALLSKQNLKAIDGPVAGSGFGISFSLDRYSKREKQKRKAKELFELMEEEAYINYRFPNEKVSEYTGLKEDGLVEFMNLYRPEYEWLREHTAEEDVVSYINKKIKAYRKVPGNKLRD